MKIYDFGLSIREPGKEIWADNNMGGKVFEALGASYWVCTSCGVFGSGLAVVLIIMRAALSQWMVGYILILFLAVCRHWLHNGSEQHSISFQH